MVVDRKPRCEEVNPNGPADDPLKRCIYGLGHDYPHRDIDGEEWEA